MTYGGYGAQPPGGPYSSSPFDPSPFDGSFGGPIPAAPPVIGSFGSFSPPGQGQFPGQPPPPSQEVNEFATLSVIFAFVFAPAGAVLGHLALRKIKRTGEPGRGRAIVGIALSYAIIVLAVVALVLWLLLPEPAAFESPKAAIAPVDALLTEPEISDLLHEKQVGSPKSGGSEALSDGRKNFTEPECLGVTAVAQQVTYEDAAVQAVARTHFLAALDGKQRPRFVGVDEAVVALPSPEAAQEVLAHATEQWTQCEGKTVTAKLGKTPSGYIRDVIFKVQTIDAMLTATLLNGGTDEELSTPHARVLAVKDHYVIETVADYFDIVDKAKVAANSDIDVAAIDMAKAIMNKIG
ncbi:sensor domain-containing protein [Mycobacterium dioxanotrophicus]|uniref:sensor domain-containing protein n=1 Tax=Mycobacterium dioxanotrophicus TaxID=482462 RepID=UPI0018DFEE0D|nr:sensor domain-containing protein [Mycobacterium dioxanotrophicus]